MKSHNKRMEPDTHRGVTFATVLSLLKPYEHVFIERSISPHELEAVGGGTVEELRAIRCVETCGDCKVERLGLTVDEPTEDWIGQDTPVLVYTLRSGFYPALEELPGGPPFPAQIEGGDMRHSGDITDISGYDVPTERANRSVYSAPVHGLGKRPRSVQFQQREQLPGSP